MGNRRLTGIAPGVNGTDAANFDQVRKAYGGVAMAFALTAVSPSLAPGEQAVTAGTGVFEDQWGFSLKYEARPADKWFVGAGVTVGSTASGAAAPASATSGDDGSGPRLVRGPDPFRRPTLN